MAEFHPSAEKVSPGAGSAGRRCAILSMDVEDWYHLDYFDRRQCDASVSLLDGVEEYQRLLRQHAIQSTFFVLGELAESMRGALQALAGEGHEVASHGWNHVRPLTLSPEECRADAQRSREVIGGILGREVAGYRAPCYSLDRPRLQAVRAAGYGYDSSKIQFGAHALYGSLDLAGFDRLSPSIYRQGDFFEFEISTLALGKRRVPVSGGGYLRIFPWWFMQPMLKRYLRGADLYVLYIHPFELSRQATPRPPAGTRALTHFRFAHGRASVAAKLGRLIGLLRRMGFAFSTFAQLRDRLRGGGMPAP